MLAIAAIAIPVSDQDRAREFYLRLGFELLAEAAMQGGARWIQMILPGGGTSITLVTWFRQMPPGCLQGLVLLTEDIHAELSGLRRQGLQAGDLMQTAEGLYFSIKDPDGNGIIIRQNE